MHNLEIIPIIVYFWLFINHFKLLYIAYKYLQNKMTLKNYTYNEFQQRNEDYLLVGIKAWRENLTALH